MQHEPIFKRAFITFGRTLVEALLLTSATLWHSPAQVSSSQIPAGGKLRAHFIAAQEAQQHGYVTAEREYRAVLIEEPNFAEVHMNLGLLYQLQDRTPEPMAEFRRALKIKPTLAGANFFVGVDYCKNGDGASAIPYLKAASRQQPKRPDIWSWLAIAQELSGDTAAEGITLKHALSLQPHDVDMLYLLGHAYEKLGNQEVTRLEKVAPASTWSEQLLGESYSSSTEWSFAVIRFQNALSLSPSRPGLHVRLGEVFLHAGRVDQAEQEFEQELRIDPNNLRAIILASSKSAQKIVRVFPWDSYRSKTWERWNWAAKQAMWEKRSMARVSVSGCISCLRASAGLVIAS